MVEQKHRHRDDDHPRHAGRDHHLGHHHCDHGGVGHFRHGGRGHVRAPASFGKAFAISLNWGARCGRRGSTVTSAIRLDMCRRPVGAWGESKRITIGWLKMAVEAKRAVVPWIFCYGAL
jgi:hypothetical protein